MPSLSKDRLHDISNNGSKSSLEEYTGSLKDRSQEELSFILYHVLWYLGQQWSWKWHMAKQGRLDEFVGLCKEIIEAGASVTPIAYEGRDLDPFHLICRSNEVKLVELFLEHGASIDPNPDGRTPLHIAASEFTAGTCSLESIKALQRKGVDINAQDGDGRTVLDIAAEPNVHQIGSKETITALQSLGAEAQCSQETINKILLSRKELPNTLL